MGSAHFVDTFNDTHIKNYPTNIQEIFEMPVDSTPIAIHMYNITIHEHLWYTYMFESGFPVHLYLTLYPYTYDNKNNITQSYEHTVKDICDVNITNTLPDRWIMYLTNHFNTIVVQDSSAVLNTNIQQGAILNKANLDIDTIGRDTVVTGGYDITLSFAYEILLLPNLA